MTRQRILHRPTILDTMADPLVFGPFFRDRASWQAWQVFLAALFGLPMTSQQRQLYRQCSGRSEVSRTGHREAWLVVGRRGGKSRILALIAVFLACFKDWRQHLAPGERGTISVIAADRKQARVIIRYVKGLLSAVPMLAELVESETRESLSLTNRITIEVHTASFKTTRGYTVVAALCDELAFWPIDDDSAEPDREIINAIRPGLASIPNSMLLCASSPYARRGALFEAWSRHFRQDHDPILVWQAPTRVMNPSIPQSVIDAALEQNPASAASEYGAEFRSDIEGFVNRDAVLACVESGVRERPFITGTKYAAFVDPSGGSSDSMTLAIAHKAGDIAVIDCIREVRPPFSPQSVVREFATVLATYRLKKVSGDRYGGEWPREAFQSAHIKYELAAKPKSAIYIDALPLLNSRRLELLDNSRLIGQLCALERRTARGGRDSIDHPPGAHDDVANSVAGVAVQLLAKKDYDSSLSWIFGDHAASVSEPVAHFDNTYQRQLRDSYIAAGGLMRSNYPGG
jgi:hypothetical protein